MMADDPNITIGSHGKSHCPLSIMPENILQDELEGSKIFIEQKTGKKVRHLSYLHGFYDERVLKAAGNCGYETALTTVHGFNDTALSPYLLRRNEVGNAGEMEIFSSIVCGGWDISKRWNPGY